MKPLVTEREARLIYLKRKLVKYLTYDRYFNQKMCTYNAPAKAIPPRIRRLIREIRELEY